MRDFTIDAYKTFLGSLTKKGYRTVCYTTFQAFPPKLDEKVVVLRHDVDALPQNSLAFAKLQAQMGLKGTYYFRTTTGSFDPEIIKTIAALGHEIGYHYETMDTCRGNVDEAYRLFEKELNRFRAITKVSTICMHGSPLSKYDNRDLWKKYDYKQLDLIAEPYFDLDFERTAYLTDTGRRWNGNKVSVRDKPKAGTIVSKEFMQLNFKTTFQIVEAINNNKLPNHIMFTFHPQRWTDNVFLWCKELLLQNLKNSVKRLIAR